MHECTAFAGKNCIARGELREVAMEAKAVWDQDRWAQILIFDDSTSELVEVDFSGTPEDVARRVAEAEAAQAAEAAPRGPGRPRLGVVPREVTLLPRHWEWLAGQPGGASVALRKLVEQARTNNLGADRRRRALEAAYRFVSAMAGNERGFEEAARALFAGNRQRFEDLAAGWPPDIREHAKRIARAVWAE